VSTLVNLSVLTCSFNLIAASLNLKNKKSYILFNQKAGQENVMAFQLCPHIFMFPKLKRKLVIFNCIGALPEL
jgi:hypothetical protein